MTGEHESDELTPHIYGAGELGVLSLTAPGAAHPRVEFAGGDVFVGLDQIGDDGAAVTQGQAEAWSHPFGEVLATTVGASSPLPEPVDGVILIQDEAQAAGVLLDPLRAAGRGLVGDVVLFVLARQHVALVGADDESGLARVLDLAEQLYEAGGRLVTAHPLMLVDGAWARFPWRERAHSLELRFERVLRLFGVRAYEAQGIVLQRPDVHIADPKIQVLETGVTVTFAAWPKGTATLLPVVDNIIIADPHGGADGAASLSVATLNQFLDAAGDAVVRTGLSPARYFVPGAPPQPAR